MKSEFQILLFDILLDILTSHFTHRPQNYKELYNLRHSSLRNAIERIFGVLKKRFPILDTKLKYPYPIQVKLVVALCVLSNFIEIVDGDHSDIYNQEWAEEEARHGEMVEGKDMINERNGLVSNVDKKIAKEKRDNIAKAMWRDYEQTKRNQGQRNKKRTVH